MQGLSFVTMLAYDYRYAFSAIKSYYDLADEIILGLDADRLSWTGRPYAFDIEDVRAFVARIDVRQRIRIVEGDFHAATDPMVNECRERSMLSREAAPGNWVVQIDADEILLNGAEFKSWLLQRVPAPDDVYCRWVTVFKVFGKQALIIDPADEVTPIASLNRDNYIVARRTTDKGVLSPLQLLHFSWGRTPSQVREKLQNWGHAKDFDTRKFFEFWDSVTPYNFSEVRNFHPLNGPTWSSLKLVQMKFDPLESG